MKLSFEEITDWQEFEDLATSFFEQVKKERNDALDLVVEPSGSGGDGGRDILVTVHVNDGFISFQRKWIVQCKFYEKDLSQSNLDKINIPTLIDEYGANGYLLICKKGVTKNVTEQFEKLRLNCRRNHNYQIWTGSQFRDKLIGHDNILKRYFPKYYKNYKETNVESRFDQIIMDYTNQLKENKL
jgi:hypothetical protein